MEDVRMFNPSEMSDPATNTTSPSAIPDGGSPAPSEVTFTADQAINLGFADAEPGTLYSVKVRVTDNSESGVKCEPISAMPAEDEPETMGDPDAGTEGMEMPMSPPRPKPTIRSPKDLSLSKPFGA